MKSVGWKLTNLKMGCMSCQTSRNGSGEHGEVKASNNERNQIIPRNKEREAKDFSSERGDGGKRRRARNSGRRIQGGKDIEKKKEAAGKHHMEAARE